jgi:hypothetical protein
MGLYMMGRVGAQVVSGSILQATNVRDYGGVNEMELA